VFRVLTTLIVVGVLGGLGFYLAGGKNRKEEEDSKTSVTELTTKPTDGGSKVRVMTANVRIADPADGVNAWQNRREFLVQTLLKYEPDFLGCQEVTPAQGAYLIKELGKWYDYYPRAGVGKTETEPAGGKDLAGSVNLVFASLNTLFFRADRFEIVDSEAGLVLPGQLQRNPTENTFYTLAVLREKGKPAPPQARSQPLPKPDEGREWIVVNTHLRHGATFAVKCAASIREKIAAMQVKYPGSHVVVMGDMNHNMRSKVYAGLVGKTAADGIGELSDCFDYSKRRSNESWGNWHAFKGVSRAALPTDLIFISGGLKSSPAELIRDKDAEGRYPSDHFFVLSEIEQK